MLYLKDIFYYLTLIYREIPPVYSEHMVLKDLWGLWALLLTALPRSGSRCVGDHTPYDVDFSWKSAWFLSIHFVSSLCSSFQIICFRNNLSNYHLSTFKAALFSLPYISYVWKAQQSVFQETIASQLPSPALGPTSQLDLYLCSLKAQVMVWNRGGLKVSGHSPRWWWWWCSQMWQMTESPHFPCTDPRHDCPWYLLCCRHRRGTVSRKDGVSKGETTKFSRRAHHVGVKKVPSFWLCLVPCVACTAEDQNWWENLPLQKV